MQVLGALKKQGKKRGAGNEAARQLAHADVVLLDKVQRAVLGLQVLGMRTCRAASSWRRLGGSMGLWACAVVAAGCMPQQATLQRYIWEIHVRNSCLGYHKPSADQLCFLSDE